MRVGVEINVREWGEGVWANADEWQSGGGGGRGVVICNSSRFRLQVGRE